MPACACFLSIEVSRPLLSPLLQEASASVPLMCALDFSRNVTCENLGGKVRMNESVELSLTVNLETAYGVCV
jgi:hypothetical protein